MMIRFSRPVSVFLFLAGWGAGHSSLLAQSTAAATSNAGDFGVLVMAHGGSREWNEAVLAAVRPLQAEWNIEVALGMADAATIQDGVAKLEARGAQRIGVVRLFVSGESWYSRTEQILGIRPGAPAPPAHDAHPGGHGNHGSGMAFWRIRTRASFALSAPGLVDAPGMGAVMAERARALSRDPGREDVLILSHGTGDDAEQARLFSALAARASEVRRSTPFRRVEVDALREDWPERRKEAEQRIRAFVQRARDEGGTAIVVPFRVQGFGPYAQVLDGLEYVSDGQGLIPHPNVTAWLAEQIEALRAGTFRSPGG